MKSLFLLLSLVSVASFAKDFVPYCTNIGTRSEGWKMPDGSVKWDNCSKKVAVCAAIGSKSEGWYAAEVISSQLIGWDNCSEDSRAQCLKFSSVLLNNVEDQWLFNAWKIVWNSNSS